MPRLLWLCALVVTVVLVEVRGQAHTCTMTCGDTPTYFNSTFEDTDEFWEVLNADLDEEFCAEGPFSADVKGNCKCWRKKRSYHLLVRYMRRTCGPKNKRTKPQVLRQRLLDLCGEVGLIELDHNGACDCACPRLYLPVCGANGESYTSACEADCRGVAVLSQGLCPVCPCPPIQQPMCALEFFKTFVNPCFAGCAQLTAADVTLGTCEAVCDCPPNPPDDAEVCGDNGKSYRSACLMECDTIDLYDCSTGCKFADYLSQVCSHIPRD